MDPARLLESVVDLATPLPELRAGVFALPPLGRTPQTADAAGKANGAEELHTPPFSPPHTRRHSLNEALRPALLFAQAFFVLPVRAGRRSRQTRTFALLALLLTLVLLCTRHMFVLGVELTSSAPVVFYSVAALSVHMLSKLSSKWAALSDRWSFPGSLIAGDFGNTARDARTCKVITLVMMACALVEHVLSVLNDLSKLLGCAEQGGALAVYKSFIVNKFPMMFHLVPFSIPMSIVILYINVSATFLWNFVDILIINISYLLAARFRTFNQFLGSAKGKDFSTFWWQEARESYNRLALLTKHVDGLLDGIVLLSFASNLYFICLQLLYNMTKYDDEDVFARLYFYFSFAWILTRAAFVSMSAASVYEQGVGPVEILYCVPSKSFNVEVQRFLVQTTTDTVALSGARFFWVTRSLVLTLAGTVATYEIVLVQFHANEEEPPAAQAHCYR